MATIGSVPRVQRRRLLRAAAAACIAPVGARAQRVAQAPRVGILGLESPRPLQQSLRELGYVEGRDVVFEFRNTQGPSQRADDLAADLVRRQVDVIVAANPAAVFSAKRATATIPIVMMHTPDPVRLGFVTSLAQPGGNITGVTTLSADLSVKQLELLQQAVPRAVRFALLWNPDNPWHPVAVEGLRERSGGLGLQLLELAARDPAGCERAFQAMAAERAQAVLLLADPMTFVQRRRLADLALARRLPMMGGLRDYAEAGSLMSYWADTADVYRRAASFVDRILRGARPADLPIEQPTKFELVLNMKTASALGIAFPPALLLRADAVLR